MTILFNIALESIVRKTVRLLDSVGIKVGNNQLLLMAAYADNIILIVENKGDYNKLMKKGERI